MPKRDYIFIDEHGDPGAPAAGTPRFASIAVHANDETLQHVVDCFASLRFYRQVYREDKDLDKDPKLRPKLADMLFQLSNAHSVGFSVTHLVKAAYTGPYLGSGDGTKFRNFQVRRLLEWHFAQHAPTSTEVEIVFDRHSHSQAQLDSFRDYLKGNWHLPDFAPVTGVDSKYVEMINVADLALRMFRRKVLQQNAGWAALDLSFIRARDVSLMSKHWVP